jgi:urea transport system ATP-binding protein
MLQIRGLNQYYGESHTLWDVDIDVNAGDCVCVMGRNGVGKTTLLRTVLGLQRARSGSIRFDEVELMGRPAHHRARLGIGYVPQGREIFAQLTVEENLRIGLTIGRSMAGPRNGATKADRADPVEWALSFFPALRQSLGRRGGDLSGGQQQQLAIARALVLKPSVLILDEPTEGIQPNVVHAISDLLLRLQEELSLTLVVVEQKLPFARRVGRRFVILDRGRVVAAGPMGDLTDDFVAKHLTV